MKAVQCFPCPYLQGQVELTDEREQHIAARTGAVENLEVLFFTRWLFRSDVKVNGLRDLFRRAR